MTKVTAKILYDYIKPLNKGFYVFANLSDKSLIDVFELTSSAPVKTFSSTELHCTIMHCKNDLPETLTDVPEDRIRTARVLSVTEWQDHKDRTIWVLALDSQDLKDVHNTLVNQGITHSYPDYNPHITFAKDVPNTPEAREWYDKINALLMKHRFVIRFDSALKATSCA